MIEELQGWKPYHELMVEIHSMKEIISHFQDQPESESLQEEVFNFKSLI